MAFRWLPNIADFFFSLARLIEDSERQLNSASYDSLKFLVRRLDEYERTLATLTSRFCETYGCVPAQQNTVADLAYLCNRVAFLRSHFQRSLGCDDNSVVVSTPGNIRPLQIEHCNRPGRPRLAITQGQLEALQRDSGFRWSDVARILCVSARTLRRLFRSSQSSHQNHALRLKPPALLSMFPLPVKKMVRRSIKTTFQRR